MYFKATHHGNLILENHANSRKMSPGIPPSLTRPCILSISHQRELLERGVWDTDSVGEIEG